MRVVLNFEEVSEILKKYLINEGKLSPDCTRVNVTWQPSNTIEDSTVSCEEVF